MTTAREEILERIRSGLGRGPLPRAVEATLLDRMAAPERSTVPQRVRLSDTGLIEEFIRMATGEATTVTRINSMEQAPKAVAGYLAANRLPAKAVLATAAAILELPWENAGIETREGPPQPEDITGITGSFAGIAETGCTMLLSGPDHPFSLNFLPENHIVLLESRRIVPTPEDAFDMLRREFGRGKMPRTALMAAGPSRSADIGTSLQFGAHGPKRLHCILVG